jgi:hypothetical protein
MKRYLFILLLLVSCDKVDIKEEDMQKYPEVLPFILDNNEFEGSHDVDLGWLHFSYTPKKTNQNPVNIMDSIASEESWKVIKVSSAERVYIKEIKSYPADTTIDSLIVKFDPSHYRLQFELH